EILRETVVHTFVRTNVRGRQGVAEADGVADETGRQRSSRQKLSRFAGAQFLVNFSEAKIETIGNDHAMEWLIRKTAQTIEDRAFHKTDAEIYQERRDALCSCPGRLLAIQLAPEIEKRNGRVSDFLRQLRRVVDDFEHFR